MNYEEAKIAAKQIGFSHIIRCEGKPSILAPYRSLSNKMSGCYLQFRADDILYILKAEESTLKGPDRRRGRGRPDRAWSFQWTSDAEPAYS